MLLRVKIGIQKIIRHLNHNHNKEFGLIIVYKEVMVLNFIKILIQNQYNLL